MQNVFSVMLDLQTKYFLKRIYKRWTNTQETRG